VDGTHTDWVKPIALPMGPHHPNGDTYLLPHVTPDGNVYTTLTNETAVSAYTDNDIVLDRSTDGGATWSAISDVITNVTGPFFCCDNNTTFRDGIFDTFTTSSTLVDNHYPLYVSWEDNSTGYINVILSASFDGGLTWSKPIQVNDNATAKIDEFQPNLTVAPNGTVSVAFYDRRLNCPAAGTAEATNAGLALDTVNANFAGTLPPYGAADYCVNSSIQFYSPRLAPIGHNIRISAHSWDPELNSPHYSRASRDKTFIGDYFGNTTGPNGRGGSIDYTTSVSTYNDGSNPEFRQQQIIATVAVP
jgi:hypothetical protein